VRGRERRAGRDGGGMMRPADEPPGLFGKKVAFLKALLEATGAGPVEAGPPLFRLGERAGLSRTEVGEVVPRLFSEGLVHRDQLDDTISVTYLGRRLLAAAPDPGGGPGGARREPYRVFISHNHEDEEVGIALKDFLVSLFGERVDVFISGDPRSNLAGNDLITTIVRNIRDCDLMLILCTPESVVRPWVNFEAGAGEASAAELEEKRIVPVCFGGLAAGAMPVLLNHRQAIDAADEAKFRGHFDVLVQVIAERTGAGVSNANVLDSPFYELLKKADPLRSPPVPERIG
jgi:hypothetical protein